MSDYQPKVGDRVMVGEHGPYEVRLVDRNRKTATMTVEDPTPIAIATAMWSWLTPAPEPEIDEPTAYGALVRDGDGRIWIHNPIEAAPDTPAWDAKDRLSTRWAHLTRPITVILADPSEVEALRDQLTAVALEAKRFHKQRDEARFERDELQRRIDKVIAYCDDPGNWGTYEGLRWLIASWLRGES